MVVSHASEGSLVVGSCAGLSIGAYLLLLGRRQQRQKRLRKPDSALPGVLHGFAPPHQPRFLDPAATGHYKFGGIGRGIVGELQIQVT